MQVKIFESTDMASGLKLVKETLGPDALILTTRTVRNGKMGILGRTILEITAAVDTPWPGPQQKVQTPAPLTTQLRKRPFSQWADDTPLPRSPSRPGQAITYDSRFRLHQGSEDEPKYIRVPVPDRRSEAETQACTPTREKDPQMLGELDELKEMVKKLGLEMSRITAPAIDRQQGLPPEQTPTSAPQGQAPDILDAQDSQSDNTTLIFSLLLAQGISATTAQEIIALTRDKLAPAAGCDNNEPQQALLQDIIRDLLHCTPQPFSKGEGQRRIALVGPTGVGKTTTLAKIAAHYLSNFSSSIALITIDTYRIAAVEQLKVYGEIMNLPVEVVITPEQLEQALLRHHDKELILIDTAGRSPRDTLCIEELATFLRPDLAIDKHLVLSATTRRTELFEAIRRFGRLGIDNTIITKTDECSTLGVMLDIQMVDRDQTIPFSYITNGQRVPEDLLTASRELVAELIMTPAQGTTLEH